jgi:lipopolysaccharide transport system permease protein
MVDSTASMIRRGLGPINSILRNRSLISELSKREVLGRYRGASFGLLWSLISPFLMLCVYTFSFGNVLGSRWPQSASAPGEQSFAIILFVGLIVHGFFAECLSRSPNLVTGNPSYVKRVVFPLEILPWPMVLSALFHLVMNVVVLIVLRVALEGTFSWMTLLLPVVVLPLVILMLGVGWFLAAFGVYFRDISQITGVLATAFLFTSSAIIPIQSVAPRFRPIFEMNPLTFIIDQARNVALWNVPPDWSGLALYLAVGVVISYFGYTWFVATRRGFGDVI